MQPGTNNGGSACIGGMATGWYIAPLITLSIAMIGLEESAPQATVYLPLLSAALATKNVYIV